MATKILTFSAIRAKQSNRHQVLSFAADARHLLQVARIDRAGRSEEGELSGFQRPQIAAHIREIQDYLKRDDAVVPNSVVIAFLADDPRVRVCGDGRIVELKIDIQESARDDKELPGLVVDGQQRISALAALPESPFEFFVSALICENEEELCRQFILINNTRPLPKSLVYELLPQAGDLPHRLSARTKAVELTERLNYRGGPLDGQIHQHTNPKGRIKDTAIQKVLMNSLSDGALRRLSRRANGDEQCLRLINTFFLAVSTVFEEAWEDHTPKTSRLVHSAGIVAMGYVMEELYERHKARTVEDFSKGLRLLEGHTAWTSGVWEFGPDERRPWNRIQNVERDIRMLTDYLIERLKATTRQQKNAGSDRDTKRVQLKLV